MKRGSFARNSVTLAGANIAAQAITLALMPLITRIYSAGDYGRFSVIIAASAILVPVSCLRLNAAIVIADNDYSAYILTRWCVVLAVASATVAAVVILAGQTLFPISIQKHEAVLYFLPALVLVGGIKLAMEGWVTRSNAFGRLAFSAIVAAGADRILAVVFAVMRASSSALLTARSLALILSILPLLRASSEDVSSKSSDTRTKVTSRSVLFRYRRFAVFSGSAVVQQMAIQAPILLIGIIYSAAEAGLYALAIRVLAEPIQILGSAIGRSFMQRASAVIRAGGAINELTAELFRYLLRIICVPLVLLAIVAPEAFSTVFGDQWQIAGLYARYLVPYYLLAFMLRPIGALFDVLERQREQLIMNLWLLIGASAALSLGLLGLSISTTLLVFGGLMAVILAARLTWILRMAGVASGTILRSARAIVLQTFTFAIILIVARLTIERDILVLGVFAMLVGAHFARIFYADKRLREMLIYRG